MVLKKGYDKRLTKNALFIKMLNLVLHWGCKCIGAGNLMHWFALDNGDTRIKILILKLFILDKYACTLSLTRYVTDTKIL